MNPPSQSTPKERFTAFFKWVLVPFVILLLLSSISVGWRLGSGLWCVWISDGGVGIHNFIESDELLKFGWRVPECHLPWVSFHETGLVFIFVPFWLYVGGIVLVLRWRQRRKA
jgi:hypothetical protein